MFARTALLLPTLLFAVSVDAALARPALGRSAEPALAPQAPEAPESPAPTRTATIQHGQLTLQIVPGPLERLGLSLQPPPDAAGALPIPLLGEHPMRIALGDGAPTAVVSGRLRAPRLVLQRADGERSPPLFLAAGKDRGLAFDLTDAAGAVWLRLRHAMRSPDIASDGLRLITGDLRVGPALARWLGRPVEGRLLAGASLQAPLAGVEKDFATKSCAVPNWPGRPGFLTDVQLTGIDSVDVLRCRNLAAPADACDGPGGAEGEVVLVPSSTLRNSDAANASEVPWYTRLTGRFPPYANDQHPFLVWNLYRLSTDGRLEQIGRSGVKHAFATENLFCSEFCGNQHILGRGCQDRYNAISNDLSSLLGPRREVVAARGLWGSGQSLMDGDCDGSYGGVPSDPYRERLRVRESDLDAALHPGARYFVDAWYVIRDDGDIHNTMGHVEVSISHGGDGWQAALAGPYVEGSPLARWAEWAPAHRHRLATLRTSEGEIALATRVLRLPDGQYRYDYAAMNFEFARATIGECQVPDPDPEAVPQFFPTVLDNRGFDRLLVATVGAAAIATRFNDGDGDPATDWAAGLEAGAPTWTAPAGGSLDWGALYSFQLTSAAAPGAGSVALRVAAGGVPAAYALDALVPDGQRIFDNGFE